MALRIRFQCLTGSTLGYSVERLADGLLLDFGDGTFKAAPATPIRAIAEDSGIFAGRYKETLTPTPPAQFTDGAYAVTIHDLKAASVVVAELACTMAGGDDTPSSAITDGKVDTLADAVKQGSDAIVAAIPKSFSVGLYPNH